MGVSHLPFSRGQGRVSFVFSKAFYMKNSIDVCWFQFCVRYNKSQLWLTWCCTADKTLPHASCYLIGATVPPGGSSCPHFIIGSQGEVRRSEFHISQPGSGSWASIPRSIPTVWVRWPSCVFSEQPGLVSTGELCSPQLFPLQLRARLHFPGSLVVNCYHMAEFWEMKYA